MEYKPPSGLGTVIFHNASLAILQLLHLTYGSDCSRLNKITLKHLKLAAITICAFLISWN